MHTREHCFLLIAYAFSSFFGTNYLRTCVFPQIVREDPVDCLRCVGSNQIILPEVRHIEHGRLLPTCHTFTANLKRPNVQFQHNRLLRYKINIYITIFQAKRRIRKWSIVVSSKYFSVIQMVLSLCVIFWDCPKLRDKYCDHHVTRIDRLSAVSMFRLGYNVDRGGAESGQHNKHGIMEEYDKQVYRWPQITGQAGNEKELEARFTKRPTFLSISHLIILTVLWCGGKSNV